MFTARNKIVKEGKALPTEFEEQVAQAILDLEVNSNDLKAELKDLNITSAKEVDTQGGKKAIVIFVPYRQLAAFHKIQARLVRELEKKFSGKHVIIVGQR
jgi:small subunit ribosomal protein S7e